MSKRGLTLLLVLLLLILAAEGALIYLYPTAGGYPWSPSEPGSSQTPPINTPPTSTPPQTQVPPEQPADKPDLFGTMTFDVENENALAGDARWTETWTVTANEPTLGATQKEITAHVTSTRSDDVPSDMTYVIQQDGTVTATKWVSNSADGKLDCAVSIPTYVPQGASQVQASMDCSANGIPLFTYTGQGTASAIIENFDFAGTKTKAQTIKITSGQFVIAGSPTPVAASFEGTFAQGIGPVEFRGSLFDLVSEQLTTSVSTEALGQLQDTTSTTLWSF